jgi:hypothetical protein
MDEDLLDTALLAKVLGEGKNPLTTTADPNRAAERGMIILEASSLYHCRLIQGHRGNVGDAVAAYN